MEFYFDGETEPRLKLTFRQLFDGTKPPFVAPLSGFGSGGFIPICRCPIKRPVKFSFAAHEMQFYQINYATYPPDTR